MSNGTVQPGEIFLNRRMTGMSCTICKNLTRAILSTMVADFFNLGSSRPSLPSSTRSFLTNCIASYFEAFLPEEINCSICPKNPTENSMQMVSAPRIRLTALPLNFYIWFVCIKEILNKYFQVVILTQAVCSWVAFECIIIVETPVTLHQVPKRKTTMNNQVVRPAFKWHREIELTNERHWIIDESEWRKLRENKDIAKGRPTNDISDSLVTWRWNSK